MIYFNNVNNIEDLRKQYKDLLKKYHPDNPNGSTEATQDINKEYDILFKQLKNIHKSENTDINIRDIIYKIINFDINIEIVGYWVWVSGNTYQYKDQLKEYGFKFSGAKKQWYYNSLDDGEKHRASKLTYEEIKEKYGYSKIKNQSQLKLGY